jgi:hypothetical protein
MSPLVLQYLHFSGAILASVKVLLPFLNLGDRLTCSTTEPEPVTVTMSCCEMNIMLVAVLGEGCKPTGKVFGD